MTEGDLNKLTPEEIEIMRARLSAEEAELEARLKAEREAGAQSNPIEEPTKEKEKPKPNKPQTPTRKPIEVNLKPGVHKKHTIAEKVGALVGDDLDTIGRFARNTTIDPELITPSEKQSSKRKPIEVNLKPKKKIGAETMAHMRAGLGARPEDDAVAKVQEEIQQLPKDEREKLGFGLNRIGLSVEQKKNELFANIFSKLKKILTKGEKTKTISRFCGQLVSGFQQNADTAHKKAKDIKEGKQKLRLENAGRLAGNVIKWGRILTDLTGASLVSPLRYVMMAGTAFTFGARAAKETRFENEKLIEKTRIADAERAYKEAWDIYERARKEEGVGEEENVSAETLKEAFLMQMPEDIKKRLTDTSVANGFLQKYFRKDLESSMKSILAQIDKIQKNESLSAAEKKIAEKKIIKKYEEKLKDFDRMLTQYGTVDELAMAGRYAQFAGKTVVAAMTVETIILSVDKLLEKLSDVVSGSGAENISTPTGSSQALERTNNLSNLDNGIKQEVADATRVAPGTLDDTPSDLSKIFPKPALDAQNQLTESVEAPSTPESLPIDPDTMIGKGEGIEHALRRQIEGNETIARALGYQGSMENTSALHEFSGIKAHEQAIAHGYVSADGQEIRIGKANEVAYQLKVEDGKIEILELDAKGNLLEKRTPGMPFEGIEGDNDQLEKNEYLHSAKPKIPVVGESLTAEELRARIEGALEGKIEPSVEIITESPKPEIELQTADKPNIGDMKKVLTPDQVLDATQSIEPEEPGTYRPYNPPSETMIPRNVSPEYGTYKPYNNPLGPVGNEIPLPSQALEQVDSIFANNLTHMFPTNTEEVWEMVKELPAEKTIGLKPEQAEEGMESFLSLIHKLRDISGLEPQSETLITSAETNEQYMKRALRFIANRKPERLAEVTMQ